MSAIKYCCMEMRINVDCNACCRKLRRILLRMKEIETHVIEKQQCRVIVCGRFRPAEVAIKIRKKMKRRVVILDAQEMDDDHHGGQNQNDHQHRQEEGTVMPQLPPQKMAYHNDSTTGFSARSSQIHDIHVREQQTNLPAARTAWCFGCCL